MCVPVEAGKMIFIGFLILVHITWCSAHPAGCDDKGPICGNDGKTYRSMCQLIWARFEDPDLAVLHDGGCTGKYASPDVPLSSIHSDGSFPEKMLLSLKTKANRNHDKIRAIMPVGWPPLGPANRQKEQKRRIIKKDKNQG